MVLAEASTYTSSAFFKGAALGVRVLWVVSAILVVSLGMFFAGGSTVRTVEDLMACDRYLALPFASHFGRLLHECIRRGVRAAASLGRLERREVDLAGPGFQHAAMTARNTPGTLKTKKLEPRLIGISPSKFGDINTSACWLERRFCSHNPLSRVDLVKACCLSCGRKC